MFLFQVSGFCNTVRFHIDNTAWPSIPTVGDLHFFSVLVGGHSRMPMGILHSTFALLLNQHFSAAEL